MQNTKLSSNELQKIFQNQQANRWHISNSSVQERKQKLKKLKLAIINHRQQIHEALFMDFKKPKTETEITEILPCLEEINTAIRHLKCWMKPEKIKTPLTLFGGKYHLQKQARGVCLILAPWNYPLQLTIAPLIAAIAAGNCVIAKPSEKSPHTSRVLEKIISSIFPQNEIALLVDQVADASLAKELLRLPFDHIFFTGSTAIGKIVMAAAAQNLSSVTLELGGKSPCIVTANANLDIAAKRITWGKFLNAGQTCVAPDYLLLDEKIADAFIEKLKKHIRVVYGDTSLLQQQSPDYARIIDRHHWLRLQNLFTQSIATCKLIMGGDFNEKDLFISPTVLDYVSDTSAIMHEEIFGPILPIVRYKQIEHAVEFIQKRDQPLALYLFSEDSAESTLVRQQTTSGGFVQNHVIVHLANSHAPFGGIGPSGQGAYHGYHGFLEFSHQRTCLREPTFFSTSQLLFAPYNRNVLQKTIQTLTRYLS